MPSRWPQESDVINIPTLPSASYKYAPFALAINNGVPPTLLNARTEFTPPGMLRVVGSGDACFGYSWFFFNDE